MSAVQYFDDIPHVVRYGMRDDEDEKSWILFWRSGVRFEVDVNGQDIRDSEFYSKWQPLLKPQSPATITMEGHIQQWNAFCDLILHEALPVLRQLAPVKSYWITLQDYLHCPSYRLRLQSNDDYGLVVPKITEGPIYTPAYELWPTARSSFKALPPSVPVYDDLLVVDKELDWRQPPNKLRSPDGELFSLMFCTKDAKSMPGGEITNVARDSINAILELHSKCTTEGHHWPSCLQLVRGIAVDRGPGTEDDTSSLMVGLLLSWVEGKRTLYERLKNADQNEKARIRLQSSAWRGKALAALHDLHSQGIYFGGREGWDFLNYHTLSIDDQDAIWFSHQVLSESKSDPNGVDVDGLRQRDLDAFSKIFDEWLVGELA